MGLNIDLHFTATSIEELKEQLKQAYEQLNGPVVETLENRSITEYQEKLADRTRAAMADKKKNLKKYTSAVFGWDADKDDNLHPNWEEQDKITLMRGWYDKLGTFRAVAKRAKEAGWKGKKGGEWTSALVKRTLNYELHERVAEFTRPTVKGKSSEPVKSEVSTEISKVAMKKRNRKYAPNNTPYGWDLLPDGHIEPNVEELAVIAAIRKAIAGGMSKKQVRDGLNTHVPTKQGGKKGWTHSRIQRILDNPLHTTFDNIGHSDFAAKVQETVLKLANPVVKVSKKKGLVNKSRKSQIDANIRHLQKKSNKKKKKAKKSLAKAKPVPPVQIEVTEDAFLRWSQSNVSAMILRDKTFLVGSKVIESWFTTINPSENYDSWASDNLPSYMTHVKSIFNEIQASYPTIFLIQDAGDNCVLMVNQPKALTARMLDEVQWL